MVPFTVLRDQRVTLVYFEVGKVHRWGKDRWSRRGTGESIRSTLKIRQFNGLMFPLSMECPGGADEGGGTKLKSSDD